MLKKTGTSFYRRLLAQPVRSGLNMGASLFLSLSTISIAHAAPDDAAMQTALANARQGNWDMVNETGPIQQDPLFGYLAYHQLRQELPDASPATVNAFIRRYSDSPISEWMRGQAQNAYGQSGNYSALLAVSNGVPKGTVRQCYYYTALLGTHPAEAARGGVKLWEVGHSQPSQCDTLFDALRARGVLTASNDWTRLMLAWESGNPSLVTFVRNNMDEPQWTDALAAFDRVYADPSLVSSIPQRLGPDASASGKLMVAAYTALAKAYPQTALQAWQSSRNNGQLSSTQQKAIEHAIAFNVMVNQVSNSLPWVDRVLPGLNDNALYELRIRTALASRDWAGVYRLVPNMPANLRADPRWEYWYARAAGQLGQNRVALHAYEVAANGRDFYAFAAADHIHRPYAMNDSTQPVSPESIRAMGQVPAIQRVAELYRIDEPGLAYSEWTYKLAHSNKFTKTVMAAYAIQQRWFGLAVTASITAKDWDALSWRFPPAYQDQFIHWGHENQVDPYLLMAIARRESAFNQAAYSPVGARGLMQLMPATARLTARRNGLSYAGAADLNDPETNIMLGSAYISSMLDRYNGNPIAATAAYNAGPGRVDQWLSSNDQPFDLFVESIPFRETRAYVQAVMSYRTILASMAKGTSVGVHMLTNEQRNADYGPGLISLN